MPDDAKFDALELARLANPEIEDMKRMALARANEPRVETGSAIKTTLLRAFRALSKGG